MRKRDAKPKTTTVGVRLSRDLRDRLQTLADELRTTPSAVARMLIELSLQGDTGKRLESIHAIAKDLQGRLTTLNQNLANTGFSLLVKDRPLTAAEAREWAKKRLKGLTEPNA